MIASVSGTIEYKGAGRLVVQVGGVGLRLLVPGSVVAEVGDIGEPVYLLTHLQVREDALTLFGFTNSEQLRLFELLISVTGVGPGVALGILSAGSADDIESAIAAENPSFFSGVPRVGPKLAARIVLELKRKVRQLEPSEFGGGVSSPDGDEVVSALLGLGYNAGEAGAAARQVPADPTLTIEERIMRALAYFNRA